MQDLPKHQYQPEKPLIDVAHAREVEDYEPSCEPQCLLKPTSGVADVFGDRMSTHSESDAIFVKEQVNVQLLRPAPPVATGRDERGATRASATSVVV